MAHVRVRLAACPRAGTLAAVRIGFLGGRFDPVHAGHLGAARAAWERHGLDRVIFVPAAHVPRKPDDWVASAGDRLAMLRLAIDSQPQFEVSDYELRKGGLSYTVETLRYFRESLPGGELFWIVGGDQLARLHEWKDAPELAGLAEFIVIARPGHPLHPAGDIPGLRLHRCDCPPIAISSTDVRDCVRRGQPLTGLVPESVAEYIAAHGLYRK